MYFRMILVNSKYKTLSYTFAKSFSFNNQFYEQPIESHEKSTICFVGIRNLTKISLNQSYISK